MLRVGWFCFTLVVVRELRNNNSGITEKIMRFDRTEKNICLLLYISFELRCLLPFSVAWKEEQLAHFPTRYHTHMYVFAPKRISLPSLWVVQYEFRAD